MVLSEAIKMALRFRQQPMTAYQIAYFLCMNNIKRDDQGLQALISLVEEEVYHNPGHFTITEDLVYLSSWQEAEKQVVQHIYGQVQQAIRLFEEADLEPNSCNNLVLALLLYKRLSDITRSQQLGTPIVPAEWKFDRITEGTTISELPIRVYDVMDYIERTDDRLSNTFLAGKEELSLIRMPIEQVKLKEVINQLSALQLDEEHVPTPLFQAIFSRVFWNNVKYTSREIGAEDL